MITRLIVKMRKKYSGWCYQAYILYRFVGMSKYKAWRGAFVLSDEEMDKGLLDNDPE